ncbi:PHP domain-containing protein [Bifidobacterium sp. ESL0790]|uniref:PHP domain-containing protein n=1 Tax=Bifidobacterium sp. ESL0790 TaxID=2983233 RepID=UPI0023F81BE1|nr:PHP domain-containing protein [Bifidobacterium sp. ESL0790]WEV72814.1 PHP domain-containing protein [Bifidobacterium sp. ESL0790]
MTRHVPPHDRNCANGWDLHCHTVYSDGTKTPAELITLAHDLGLHGVAITDHDTTAGWADAARQAEAVGLPLLRGTEITAEDGAVSVHMLAYQYDPKNEAITELFRATRLARVERAKRMVARLAEDFPISWESVTAQAKQGKKTTVGRPHMADALVAAGVYATRSDAFAGAISGTSKYYIPTPSPSTHEVVRTVREAGGVSVIAHPGDRARNRVLLSDRQIRDLAAEGLGGLEVWHRGNDEEQRRRLLGLADELGLLVTGGSDWHGAGKPNLLGENLTDDATVAEIVRRGAIPLVG